MTPPEYNWGDHHGILYHELNEFAHGRTPRLIIEAPPGCGKSEASSRILPPFIFGIRPDARIIAVSYSQDLASEMNRDVQRVMDSPQFLQVFPHCQLGGTNVRALAGKPRRNSDVFDIVGYRGIYKSAGVGVGIGGRRFDFGIIDDPIKDREEANSAAHREKVWRWYTSVFLRRRAKGAAMLLATTRWHEDDLVGRIKKRMAEGKGPPWKVVTLQALATDNIGQKDPRRPIRHPMDQRQVGEALWPWFRSAAEYESAREEEPRDFWALDQQDPRTEGGNEWGAEYFGPDVWFDEWPKNISLLVIALDPSKGKNASSGDYSAFVVLALTNDGTLWVEADLARRNVGRIVEDGLELCRRIQDETGKALDGLGCEADAFQELLANDFVRVAKDRGQLVTFYQVRTEGVNKEVRILRLSSHITKKQVRFRNTRGTRLLVDQLTEFPKGEHDDGPDAFEMARRLAIKLQRKGR